MLAFGGGAGERTDVTVSSGETRVCGVELILEQKATKVTKKTSWTSEEFRVVPNGDRGRRRVRAWNRLFRSID